MARGHQMMIRFSLSLLLAVSIPASGQQLQEPDRSAAQAAIETIRPLAIRGHMRFLSDSLLGGRAPGTTGYEIAARYVAAELESMGVLAAGGGGAWFQSVPIRKAVLDSSKSSVTLSGNGRHEQLVDAVDYVLFADGLRKESAVESPLVFVGFGVTAPELNYDDYSGADVRGKIVVLIGGAPSRFPSTQRAYYSEGLIKSDNAAAHGAVGTITISLPENEQRYPWSWVVPQIKMGGLYWLDEKHSPFGASSQLRAEALFSHKGTEILFSGAPKTLAQVFTAARTGEPQAFPLRTSVSIHTATAHTPLESSNIIGQIRGSDPVLRDQYVVYSAHVDHIGLCPPIRGDNVCHGAWDNASGVATLLEIARAYTKLPQKPRRSILFLFDTGEEIGFLGSGFFVHNPPVPLKSIVADVNIDGAPGLLGAKKDMVNYCAGHLSLDRNVELAAREVGYEISPDPMPEETLFIRSDQFSFALEGVPVVFINDGFKSTDSMLDGGAVFKKYLSTQYHTPLDNMDQPFDYESAAKASGLNFLVGYEVAQQDTAPSWNDGDFFGTKFGQRRANPERK
jgi:hypothetical protein